MGLITDLGRQPTHGRNPDTSDEALDDAAGFQQGFQEYLPLYNDYTGSSLSLRNDVQRPYDSLREIDFRRLSEVAERGAAIAGEFRQTREEINTRVAGVTGVTGWSGDAANAFAAHIQRFQTAAQTVDAELGQIASATGEVVPAARSIIAEYTDTIGEIDFSGFDSPELIRILITIERMAMSVSELVDRLYDGIGDLIGMVLPVFSSGGGGLFGSIPVVGQVVDAASDLVGDFIGGVLDFFGGADDLLALASRLTRSYLDASFKQPFENNIELLNGAVEAAERGITQVFQPMTDAAGAVTAECFTALGEAPAADPQPPSSVTPGIGEPLPAESQPSGATEPGSPGTPAGAGALPASAPGTATMPEPTGSPADATDVLDPYGTAGASDMSGTAGISAGTGTAPETTSTAGGVPAAGPGTEPVPQPEPSTAQPEPLPTAQSEPPIGLPEQLPTAQPELPIGLPEPLPTAQSELPTALPEPLPTAGDTGDGPGGWPDELLPGAGWIADPSQLPAGWTVDQETGELLPPGAPGGAGDPEVHSSQGQAALDGPDPGEATILPADDFAGAPPEASMRLGDRTIAFSPVDESGQAVGVTLTGSDGGSARYEIRIDEQGNPQLVPATTTVPAADGFGSGTVDSFAAGAIGSGHSAAGGEVSAGDEGYAAASESGRTASGSVSFGGDPPPEPDAGPTQGSARLASASMASDTGTVSTPGEAHLASAAEGTGAEQQSSAGGMPFMPMGGAAAGGGGDEQRHGGLWQVPGTDMFEAEDEPAIARGILGGDR